MVIRSVDTKTKVKEAIADNYGASFIIERYAAGLSSIQNRISDFWLNHAFLLGYQWTYVEERTGLVRETADEPDREQAVINRMAPNMRIIIAKLTQRELSFEVPPTGADDGSIRGARIAESILRATRVEHRWEELREKASLSAMKGGTSAIAVDWDPNAGRVTVGPSDDSAEIRGGDTIEQVLSISEFVVEPGVRDAETARWWIKVEALPPETVRAIYDMPETPRPDMNGGVSGIQRKLVASSGSAARSSGGTNDNLTLVLTYYERPNLLSPQGRISVVVNGMIVEGENPDTGEKMPWPYPFRDHLNFALIRETITESEWAGQTILTQTRGVQATFNATWSSIIEHMKLAGNARLAVPESSIDLIDEFTDLPGEVVPYPDGSTPPFYLQPSQLPAWLIDTPVNLALQMDDIMGVHDISRGIAPANIESGFGISILAEQDSTPVGRLAKEIARAFTKVGTMVLEIFEKEVKSSRESIVADDGGPPMTTQWVGKDLLGQTRATVPLESIIPRNRAAQLQLAKDLQAGGLITTLDDFIAVADLADGSQILEKVSPDTARARRENHYFRAERGAHPYEYDDHAIHIHEHNILRKSTAYEMMTRQMREIVDLHVKAHETLAAGDAADAQSAMAVGGAGLASAPTANEIPLPEDLQSLLGTEELPGGLGTPPPSGDTIPDVAPPPLI